MRDAAVGFQCPECVAEGKKTTRSGRTAYGGLRPTNASTTTLVLIGINVAVWLAILASGAGSSRLVDILALRPNGLCSVPGQGGFDVARGLCAGNGGEWLPGVSDGAYWQLVTSAFTHVQVLHIAFNMFALYLFGPQLEIYFGRVRYLALYFISALTGSALVYWAGPEFTPTVGASGAIFGLLGAMLVVSLKIRVNVQGIVVLLAVNFLMTATISNISWQGHVGGFGGGVLVAGILVYAPRQHRTAYQSAGLVAVTAVTVLAIVARTAALA
jgi:membrane associated rhomboid family serine protease